MRKTGSIILLAGALLLAARAETAPALGIWHLDVQVGDVVWQDRIEVNAMRRGVVIAWSDRMGDMRGMVCNGIIILTSVYRSTEPMGTYIWTIHGSRRPGRYCSLHVNPLEGIPDAFGLRSYWHRLSARRLDKH